MGKIFALAVVVVAAACGPTLTGDGAVDGCLLLVDCEGVPNDTETPQEFCERRATTFDGCEDEVDAVGDCLIKNAACVDGDFTDDGACDEEVAAQVDCEVAASAG